MTPKEKAKELIDKYCKFDFVVINHDKHIEQAKQCALIAVEQIETITKHYPPDYMLTVYWQQVKKQIELL